MDMNLSKLQELMMDRKPEVVQSQSWLSEWTELNYYLLSIIVSWLVNKKIIEFDITQTNKQTETSISSEPLSLFYVWSQSVFWTILLYTEESNKLATQ